ncbi:MAG: hypothetical protein JW814_06470 [Candidatus Krumholzibacteriota bacterium]|nr:hypothetical protein [Candidatus Krumholzibacteriota bacterium]
MTAAASIDEEKKTELTVEKTRTSLDNRDYSFDALFRLFEKLGTTLELDKVIRLFVMTLAGQLSLGQISFYLFSRKTEKLDLYYSLGLGRENSVDSISIDSGFVNWLLSRGYPAKIELFVAKPDDNSDEDQNVKNLLVDDSFRYAYPLIDGGELQGMIIFGDRITGEGFTDFNIEILHMMTRIASMTVKNAALYEHMVQSRIKLENFSKMKREFMHHTSHELRTPLTILKSSLSSIDPREGSDAMLVNIAMEAVNKLAELVEQVLSLNAVESDESFFNFQKTEMAGFLEKYSTDIISVLAEKGITLKFDKIGEARIIRADSAKIRIALDRIIDNAVSSLYTGGTICLESSFNVNDPDDSEGVEIRGGAPGVESTFLAENRREEEGYGEGAGRSIDKIKAGDDFEGYFVIRIRDDGVGIPAGEIKDMGEPFTRASNSRTSEVKGLGLGLSVSQKIIAGHGGHLLCKSSEGNGAEFSIWLPVAK